MRTTVDLSDDLFRKAKAVSSLRGLSLKQFITKAIEHELQGNPIRLDRQRVTLPLVKSRNPGGLAITPEQIATLLEAEDLHVPS